ncbi:hypothetical protein [Streptomyces sp. NPDC093544]|uniref:hypothetical protein n=1 Tax=Streptomyces sp. NPDC093544 TaxID=3155200 RepID=UPI003436CC70
MATIANRRYAPECDAAEQTVVKDYGLVVRCQNPFDPSRKSAAFLVMGCHGFGTAGSAQLLRDPALARQLASEVEQRDFVAIAEIQVQGQEYRLRQDGRAIGLGSMGLDVTGSMSQYSCQLR